MSSKVNTAADESDPPPGEDGAENPTGEPEVVVVNEPTGVSEKPSFYEDGGIDQESEAIVETAIDNSQTKLEAEASAAPPKPIPKHYIITDANQGSSLVYEKDGNWMLEKVPLYTFMPKNVNNNDEFPNKKCCLDPFTEPPTLQQNIKAIYDVVIGGDSIPCNECDKNLCKETLLQWLTSIVYSLADTVKELSAVIPTTSSACGKTDAEAIKLNTKGTYADLDDDNPVPAVVELTSKSSVTETAPEENEAMSSEGDDLKIELVEKPDEAAEPAEEKEVQN